MCVGLRNICMDLSRYYTINGDLQIMGFTKSETYPNLYYIFVYTNLLILVLYVDDLFLTGAEKLIVRCKEDMAVEVEMKDISLMHHFLGLEVCRDRGRISLGKVSMQFGS